MVFWVLMICWVYTAIGRFSVGLYKDLWAQKNAVYGDRIEYAETLIFRAYSGRRETIDWCEPNHIWKRLTRESISIVRRSVACLSTNIALNSSCYRSPHANQSNGVFLLRNDGQFNGTQVSFYAFWLFLGMNHEPLRLLSAGHTASPSVDRAGDLYPSGRRNATANFFRQ